MAGIYPGQSTARIGCDHLTTNLHCPAGGSTVQEQGGGALEWSVAVHWVPWPWDFPSGAGQGQPPPYFAQGHLA